MSKAFSYSCSGMLYLFMYGALIDPLSDQNVPLIDSILTGLEEP